MWFCGFKIIYSLHSKSNECTYDIFCFIRSVEFLYCKFGIEEECAYDYFFQYLADCEGNNNSSLSMYV